MRTPKTGRRGADPYFLRLTVAQLVLAALVLALLFGVMKLRPALFGALREEFSALMARDLDPGAITFFPKESETDGALPTAPPAREEETAPEEAGTAATAPEEEPVGGAGGEDLPAAPAADPAFFALYENGEVPVMPVAGRITSDFGERVHPVYGTQGFHAGRDLGAEEGTPIHAALDGVVVGAGVGEKSGNYVKLDHGDGLETLYCHCSSLNVTEGVAVRRGDVIAFVGQTGLATGPHLHFEVRVDGASQDPGPFLENACVVS